jgi:hypothetical protein
MIDLLINPVAIQKIEDSRKMIFLLQAAPGVIFYAKNGNPMGKV